MSETKTTDLYKALLQAQRDFSAVVKNKQNPHLKNYYADLGAVLDAVTGPLENHGLLIVQRFSGDQGSPVLITELVHAETGQSIASALPILCKDQTDPQKLGGAITYARRYSLLALLGLAPEDDDGHAAAQPPAQGRPAPNFTRPRDAGRDTPPARPEHPALDVIRNDLADPKLRKKALHAYYDEAPTIGDLNTRAERVIGMGIPSDDLKAAYRYHHERLSKQLTPVASK